MLHAVRPSDRGRDPADRRRTAGADASRDFRAARRGQDDARAADAARRGVGRGPQAHPRRAAPHRRARRGGAHGGDAWREGRPDHRPALAPRRAHLEGQPHRGRHRGRVQPDDPVGPGARRHCRRAVRRIPRTLARRRRRPRLRARCTGRAARGPAHRADVGDAARRISRRRSSTAPVDRKPRPRLAGGDALSRLRAAPAAGGSGRRRDPQGACAKKTARSSPSCPALRRSSARSIASGPSPTMCIITPLYGALTPQEQNDAIAPAPKGTRKVVVATDIAESAHHDRRRARRGRLQALPACRASIRRSASRGWRPCALAVANADQRRGRAGRTGPGVCYRLWREAEMRGFAASPSPEIENADLTGLALDLARWGAKSPADLRWLNPPREAPWRAARSVLAAGGALTADGELTSLGKRLGDLPLPPRLALMVLRAAERGRGATRGRDRRDHERARSRRTLRPISTNACRASATRTASAPARCAISRRAGRRLGRRQGRCAAISAGAVLALGFPERIATLARAGAGTVRAGGRARRDAGRDRSAGAQRWLAVADMTGSGPDLRITLAARHHGGRCAGVRRGRDEGRGAATIRRRAASVRGASRRLGAIVLEEAPLPAPTGELVRDGPARGDPRDRASACSGMPSRCESVIAPRRTAWHDVIGAPWPADFRRDADRAARGLARPAAGVAGCARLARRRAARRCRPDAARLAAAARPRAPGADALDDAGRTTRRRSTTRPRADRASNARCRRPTASRSTPPSRTGESRSRVALLSPSVPASRGDARPAVLLARRLSRHEART